MSMAARKPKQTKEPIAPAKYGSLTEEEIIAMAKEISDRNKPALERMSISTPEDARTYLVSCGYDKERLPEILKTPEQASGYLQKLSQG